MVCAGSFLVSSKLSPAMVYFCILKFILERGDAYDLGYYLLLRPTYNIAETTDEIPSTKIDNLSAK